MRTNSSFSRWFTWLVVTTVFQGLSVSIWAHPGHGAGGFETGLAHPWSGLDHILAMVAVGIWSVQLRGRATWLLPVVFPLVMALGGGLGVAGFQISGIEIGIACSALVLGALVGGELRARLPVAALLVGLFALIHGYAHGSELPTGQNGIFYSVGFVISTVSLHCLGILLGRFSRWPKGKFALRTAGAIISVMGVIFLLDALR